MHFVYIRPTSPNANKKAETSPAYEKPISKTPLYLEKTNTQPPELFCFMNSSVRIFLSCFGGIFSLPHPTPPRGFVSIYQGDALTAKGRANTIRARKRKTGTFHRWQEASFQSLNRHRKQSRDRALSV